MSAKVRLQTWYGSIISCRACKLKHAGTGINSEARLAVLQLAPRFDFILK